MKVRELERFTVSFCRHWNQHAVDFLLVRFNIRPSRRSAQALSACTRRWQWPRSPYQPVQQEGHTVLFSSHLTHDVERVADRIGLDASLPGGVRTAHYGSDLV